MTLNLGVALKTKDRRGRGGQMEAEAGLGVTWSQAKRYLEPLSWRQETFPWSQNGDLSSEHTLMAASWPPGWGERAPSAPSNWYMVICYAGHERLIQVTQGIERAQHIPRWNLPPALLSILSLKYEEPRDKGTAFRNLNCVRGHRRSQSCGTRP